MIGFKNGVVEGIVYVDGNGEFAWTGSISPVEIKPNDPKNDRSVLIILALVTIAIFII